MNNLTIQQGLIYGGIAGLIVGCISPIPKMIAIIGGAALGVYVVYNQKPAATITPITQPTA